MGIRAEQKEKRRQDILDTALDLFVHRGYAGTSVRDIAGSLKISPSLLFHYFNSKEDILTELMELAMSGVGQAAAMFTAEKSPLAQFEDIAGMIFGSITFYPQTASIFLLVHHVSISDSVPLSVKKIIARNPAVEKSVPVILEGQKRGEIREGDPMALAIAFWGAIQGIAETIAMSPLSPTPNPAWVAAILKKPHREP